MFGGNLVGFLEILESYVVIDNSKVQKLRESIFIENPLMTNEERSRHLIKKIHTIINDELSGIDEEHLRKIRTLVLHRSVKNNSIIITYSDIIQTIAELNLSLEETIEDVKAWYDIHLSGSEISLIQLTDYIKTLQELYKPEEPVEQVLATPDEGTDIEIPRKDAFILKKRFILGAIGAVLVFAAFIALNEPTIEEPTIEPLEREYQSISFMSAQSLFDISTTEESYFNESIQFHTALDAPGVPEYLNYHSIDKGGLQAYLRSRNSILAELPYFEGIITVSKEYDIHPLLMFAITGQEQGYVNKENPNHLKIANNPFNVYTSWRKYNTDIEDSTAIAAGTVITILRKRPAGENPFKWINTRYAEDKNWARGVEMIFNFLMQYEL